MLGPLYKHCPGKPPNLPIRKIVSETIILGFKVNSDGEASGRGKAGSGIQGFWIPCQSSNYLNSNENKHLRSKDKAWCFVLRVKIKIFLPLLLQNKNIWLTRFQIAVTAGIGFVPVGHEERGFCIPLGGAEMSPQLTGQSPFDKNQFTFTWNGHCLWWHWLNHMIFLSSTHTSFLSNLKWALSFGFKP